MRSFVLLLLLSPLGAAQDSTAARTEIFENKIRPLLVARCVACHSSDPKKQKGGLALDSREGMLKGGDTGPAVVPGEVEKSLLVKAIRYRDAELRMPPPKEKTRLSPEQVADLEAWIRQGAVFPPSAARKTDPEWEARKQWLFTPPADPPVPARSGENPIDAFLLRKLAEKGLGFAPAELRARIDPAHNRGAVSANRAASAPQFQAHESRADRRSIGVVCARYRGRDQPLPPEHPPVPPPAH